MTRTLYVAARSTGENAAEWATVGVLTKAKDLYEFRYTDGAKRLAGVAPFPGMPELDGVYQSQELLPIFKNRLLSKRRPEYRTWLSWGGFHDDAGPDAMSILATLGSRRAADSLELYAGPHKLADGNACVQFFLHGVRHYQTEETLQALTSGMVLSLRPEDDNPFDRFAVAVDDNADNKLGYVPRYLTRDIRYLIENCPDEVQLRVKQANSDAPTQYQILCELQSCWPVGFEPCSGPDFRPVSAEDSANPKSAVGFS